MGQHVRTERGNFGGRQAHTVSAAMFAAKKGSFSRLLAIE